jgi:hypothetical protein
MARLVITGWTIVAMPLGTMIVAVVVATAPAWTAATLLRPE